MSKDVRYKLLKWYPGLPKDWEEGMEVRLGDYPTNGYTACSSQYTQCRILPSYVRSNPEYWEKIKEKNYEILSLSFGDEIYLKTGKKVTSFPFKEKDNEFRVPNKKGLITDRNIGGDGKYDVKIHSVKRLSDGKVFTIGDKVESRASGTFYIINKFIIRDEKLGINKSFEGWCEVDINSVRKIPEPLLTTEDGEHLHKGDLFYGVTQVLCNEQMVYSIVSDRVPTHSLYEKTFSNPVAAEDWIHNNKPQYSKNDVIKACLKSRLREVWSDTDPFITLLLECLEDGKFD